MNTSRWQTKDIFSIINEEIRFDDRSQRFLLVSAERGWLTNKHFDAIFSRYSQKQTLEDKIKF